MLVKDSTGKEVELSYIGGKYDDDIQVGDACYTSTGDAVEEDEMEYIYDTYATELYEQWWENKMAQGADFYEGER